MPIDKTRIKYFTIKWTALVSLLDGLDADDNPDTDFITGIITLRPSKKNLILQYRDPTDPFTVVPMQRRVTVDAGSFSDQGRTYLKLEAASPDAVPTQWFWEAIFDLNYKGSPIVIPNIQFMGIPDTIVDFTNELPVFDAITQVEYARGPQGNSVQRIEITGAGNDTIVFYSTALGNPEISRITIPQLTTANEAASVAVVASELANQFRAAADAFADAADAHRVAAAASAADALGYRNTASGHATTASTQAGIATTKAAEAAASAIAAGQAVIGQIPDASLRHIKFTARDMSNLMPSGDMEVDIVGDLDAAPTFTYSYDTTNKWEGSRSIRITSLTGEARGKGIPTSPGEIFQFSMMCRADAAVAGPGGMRIQAYVGSSWVDVSPVKSQRSDISAITVFSTWDRSWAISVMPAGATRVRWRLAFQLTSNPGFNYDDLDFRRIPELFAPNSVTGADIAQSSITSGHIVNDSIQNQDINSAAGITGGKLAAQTITAAQIANDAVITTRILDANVTLAKLATGSVDSSKIVDGSIVNADINSAAAIAGSKIASGTIGSTQITDGGIATVDIADLAITLAKLASGSVDSSKIVDGSILLADLASGSVDSSKIVDGSIVDADINAAAAIAMSKLGVGKVLGSNNGAATTLTIWVGTEAQYTAISSKDASTLYFRTA
jgi:hypothetical protein